MMHQVSKCSVQKDPWTKNYEYLRGKKGWFNRSNRKLLSEGLGTWQELLFFTMCNTRWFAQRCASFVENKLLIEQTFFGHRMNRSTDANTKITVYSVSQSERTMNVQCRQSSLTENHIRGVKKTSVKHMHAVWLRMSQLLEIPFHSKSMSTWLIIIYGFKKKKKIKRFWHSTISHHMCSVFTVRMSLTVMNTFVTLIQLTIFKVDLNISQ